MNFEEEEFHLNTPEKRIARLCEALAEKNGYEEKYRKLVKAVAEYANGLRLDYDPYASIGDELLDIIDSVE